MQAAAPMQLGAVSGAPTFIFLYAFVTGKDRR